ncbi:unnamed protein product, partial [Hapterophycus canaliculatus]
EEAGDEASTGGQSADEGDVRNAADTGKGQASWTTIPFFGSVDGEAHSSTWSHLNHRVEEYREDLVKVVQSLDMIINTLESSAQAKGSVGERDRDMPGEGMRQLAAKLRRKLDKTPPRWQVNTDVLSWLLRPVPFVTGLPWPSPPAPFAPAGASKEDDHTTTTTTKSNNENNKNNHNYNTPVGHERKDRKRGGVDIVVVPTGDAFGEGGEEEVVERMKYNPAGEARSAASAAVRETRAMPVPVFEGAREGEDVGSGGAATKASKKRAGFHAYDETHQVFTHILRDWTSEGDTVRAGVYDPLLRALDEYVGWQDDAAAPAGSPIGRGERSSASSDGGTTRSQGQAEPPPDVRFPSLSSASPAHARRRMANVLVPGAGLGRLAAEVAARGYASVHANELSTTMLSSCYWLMEALRGADFVRDATPTPEPVTPVDRTESGEGKGPPLSPAPAAHTMSERGGVGCVGSPYRKCDDNTVGGEAGSCRPRAGGEEGPGREGEGGEGKGGGGGGGEDAAVGRSFFEFYPFLNDAGHNEIDGDAR